MTDAKSNRVRAEMTLTVNIERDFGDVKISYGLSGVFSIASYTELTAAYDELRTQIENQHELAQKNRPQLMPTQLKQHLSQNQSIVFCTAIRKESIQGKVRIRLLGGEFTTHGIACYPEFFDDLAINPEILEWGDNPYSNHVLVQFDQSGNPKRAITIVEA